MIIVYCDVNDEKSNQKFISFDDYSVSERVYSYDEAIKLQEVFSDQGFFVDESIAQAISELNRKGYITKYCCSGHLFKDRQPIRVEEKKEILELLPKRKEHLIPKKGYIEISEDDEKYTFLYNGACSMAYVAFAEGVEIDSIPEGFYLDSEESAYVIRAEVECCTDEGSGPRFISDDEAREGLRQISRNLQEWANTLPYKKTASVRK